MFILQFLIKAEVYYNDNNPLVEFKLLDGSESFATLKETLNGLFPDSHNRRVKYNIIELKNDEDVKTM